MINTCCFCDINAGKAEGIENKKIQENEKYFSLASIGPLVPGWILIIPKNHILSMKDLYNQNDFIDFANETLRTVKRCFPGPVIAFEHGPSKHNSVTACGTNHAHLHLVPYRSSLYPDMVATGLAWESCTASQVSSIAGVNEYFFYSELPSNSSWKDPKGFIHVLEESESQFFRQLIAKQLGRSDEFNYKKFPHTHLAIETSLTLSRVSAE